MDAVTALISKLLLPRDIVSREERTRTRAEMVYIEYSNFTLKMGKFKNANMWRIAEDCMQFAHEWHRIHSFP